MDLLIDWEYRDARNLNNNGIDNITLEFVTQTNASTNGSIYNATFSSAGVVPLVFGKINNTDNSSLTAIYYPYSTATLSPGEWRIRANYTNIYEDDGKTKITYLSQPFYIEGDTGNCTGVKLPTSGD